MILSDSSILKAIDAGDIVIDPFDRMALGGNSYDVHLGPTLVTYARRFNLTHRNHYGDREALPLDAMHMDRATDEHAIEAGGFVLEPSRLYLASTVEYTETHKHVPYLDGKSSIGRLGISIHETAGRGDVGFCGHWTLEIVVVQPIRVYAGMPIGQLTFHEVTGEILQPYKGKTGGAGYGGRDPKPQPSRLRWG
jgi:dCTP deaminase